MSILFSVRAKGMGGLAARMGTILSRFGPTAPSMESCLNHYADLTNRFDVRPTFPITASVLARHAHVIRPLVDRNVEFAIHGLYHNDHGVLSLDEQRRSIPKAAAIFRRFDVPYAGFRGPYLRYNQATDEVVSNLGLSYHSSQAVAFSVLPPGIRESEAVAYQRALQLYGAEDARRVVVRPRHVGGLIKIPVVIPDDEIMVDRLHLNQQAQAATWLAILELTYEKGELFTVQLHPERIFCSGTALSDLLEEARTHHPAVWIASLDQMAAWWRRRQGWALEIRQVDADRYQVRLEADSDATLLVRGLPSVEATDWYGRDSVARHQEFVVTSPVKPVVGVSTRSPRSVLGFLREEGIPAEISDDPSRFGSYLNIPGKELDEVEVLSHVEQTLGPLVRLWRWPLAARSALAVTGDIDSITLKDFAIRLWEKHR